MGSVIVIASFGYSLQPKCIFHPDLFKFSSQNFDLENLTSKDVDHRDRERERGEKMSKHKCQGSVVIVYNLR